MATADTKQRLEFSPDMIIWDTVGLQERPIKNIVKANAIPEGTLVRIGRGFTERNGKQIISWLQDHGYPVFYDAGIIGDRHECLDIMDACLEQHPYMLSIMGGTCDTGEFSSCTSGPVDILKRFAEVCMTHDVRSCVITKLMSKKWGIADQEFKNGAKNQAMFYVDLAYSAGATDILCDKWTAGRTWGTCYSQLGLNVPAGENAELSADTLTIDQAIRGGVKRLIFSGLTRGDIEPPEACAYRNYNKIREEMQAVIARLNLEQ